MTNIDKFVKEAEGYLFLNPNIVKVSKGLADRLEQALTYIEQLQKEKDELFEVEAEIRKSIIAGNKLMFDANDRCIKNLQAQITQLQEQNKELEEE